jgi:hypothetical protein
MFRENHIRFVSSAIPVNISPENIISKAIASDIIIVHFLSMPFSLQNFGGFSNA